VAALASFSALELLAGYRERDFSPAEVVDALAERIAELDPILGAFRARLPGLRQHPARGGALYAPD
jgi:Asp-tRNA(Asn)/Glu-tRNA(Gln) amidotransferase A subunit family amidase